MELNPGRPTHSLVTILKELRRSCLPEGSLLKFKFLTPRDSDNKEKL